MRKKWKVLLLSLLASALLLAGCGQQSVSGKETVDDTLAAADNVSKVAAGATVSKADSSAGSAIPVCTLDTSDMFTDRDKEVGFDENSDVAIRLNGASASCSSGAVQISGSTVTITDEGTYIISGTLTDGSIVVEAEDTDKLQLVLNGVDITCKSSAAIYVKQADKVFVTLAPGTENSLQTTGEFVAIDDNNIDGVIFSKDDLTLNGSGSLEIDCAYGHGIVSKDDLVITGGSLTIQAAKHGLSGKDSVRIAAGAFSIEAGEDGIHSENDEDTSLGFVYVAGGSIAIAAGDDGIHAGSQVLIEEGEVNISESYEGIEGMTVDIAGGVVSVHSSDDGLNATAGSSSETAGNVRSDPFASTEGVYVKISGGTLKVTAYGDSLDSNGSLYVTGGITYVSGPENSGNGSIDYNGTGIITGGTFAAAGASGMAQNFGSDSTQGAMLVNLSSGQSAGTAISLVDAAGKELVSFVPETLYNSVLISCPELQTGNTYTLTAGTESVEIEMTDTIYGSGGGFGGRGNHGGMGAEGFGGKENWGGSAPEGFEGKTRPDGSVPEGSAPEGFEGRTRPDGSVPEGSAPEGFEGRIRPEGGMPEGSAPEGFEGKPRSDGSVPEGSVSEDFEGQITQGESKQM